MKYLTNGLKCKNNIIIDKQNDDSDIDQEYLDVQKQQNFKTKQCIKINDYNQKNNRWKITPIHRQGVKKPKPKPNHKIQQIQISDQDEHQNERNNQQQSSFQRVRRMVVNQPQKLFKKRLVKVANKCKIQGKQYSSTQCSICLSSLQIKEAKEIGKLKCKHAFCFQCILQNSKFSNKCPYCRTSYMEIIRDDQLIPVEEKQLQQDYDSYDEPCYVCGRNDDFDHLLECQYCQGAFCHTYCDNRLQSDVPPQQSWYCLSCSSLLGNN